MIDRCGHDILTDAFLEVMRNSDDYVFVKDRDLIYHGGSECFAKMAGLRSAAELIGRNDYDIFPKDIAGKYRGDDMRVLSGETIEGIEERIPDKNGRQRWTKTWKHAIYDADKNVIGLYGISRDISHIVGLEENAEESRKYADLIRNMPGGVGILHRDSAGFILDYANEGWARAHHLSGAEGDNCIGKNIISYVNQSDRPLLLKEFEHADTADGGGSLTYRTIGGDGLLHWISVQFGFAYEKNAVRYYYASYADMDDQKLSEEKLADSQNALRDAVANSDIQFFTYFPGMHRCEIYAVNNRLGDLPMVWEDFPRDFLAYAKATPEDAHSYADMLAKIDDGADDAECTIRLAYQGVFTWERLRIHAVRDDSGRTVKAQGYSINVTEKKNAEDRLRRERVRLKALEGNTFEAFSFNITQNSEPEVQTLDKAMLEGSVDPDIEKEALRISPPIGSANAKTREVLLRAAGRIPDAADRELFIETFGGSGMRVALNTGRYSSEIRYRHYVGQNIRWVSSRAEILPDPDSGDMIAFYYTTNINDDVVNEKLSQRIIGMNYESVSFCDLQTRQLFTVASTDPIDASFNGTSYEEAVALASGNVEPKYSGEFRDRLALCSVMPALEKNPVYSVYYPRNNFRNDIPGNPRKQMKTDIFYLDEHRDILVFLVTDVTDIFEKDRENRDKMATALIAAKQASSAKSNFLARMSHEIRTPLNAIIGMDTIAAQTIGNTEKVSDCIAKIGLSARYLLSLINDILDMSRIESGKMLIKNEVFLFSEFILGINNIIYPQSRTKGIDFECTVSNEIDDSYIGDEMKLQQILVNVLGNALKFTEKGRVALDISVVSREGSMAKLRFVVNDTGCGISEENQARIFDAFEQVDTSTTSVFGGTGLGLAITKNLANLMGGSISVRSIVGIGSEFTIDIPLETYETTVQPIPVHNLRNMHTLIVDDDLLICEQTSAILKDIGMIGEWVTTGQEAVGRVRDKFDSGTYYNFILVDWKMPDMDGLETTQQIRRIVGPDVTIIIISAYDWQSIEAEARAAGANMLVSKPLLRTTLVSAFEKALGKEDDPVKKEPAFDFSGRRVLVVEDNELNAEIARTLLQSKNFAVETASNGIKALEMFVKSDVGYYDAILMDVRMPMMDGLQATVNIRHWNKADAATIPIIAMTANAFEEDVEKSRAAGMNAHLSKPIDPELMFGTLYRLMEKDAAKQ